MEVFLRPHTGYNLASRKPSTASQYMVFVDGQLVGYMPWWPGASLLLIRPFGPIERREIEQAVADQMNPADPEELASICAPDVPPELLEDEDDMDDEGFFDDDDDDGPWSDDSEIIRP